MRTTITWISNSDMTKFRLCKILASKHDVRMVAGNNKGRAFLLGLCLSIASYERY